MRFDIKIMGKILTVEIDDAELSRELDLFLASRIKDGINE